MNIAVLCPSEIAYRRFMPAASSVSGIAYAGVGMATPEEHLVGLDGATPSDRDREDSEKQRKRTVLFQKEYGGKVYESYAAVLGDPFVDAVYIPLPPALHYCWAKRALEAGKHVLLEKPFTTSIEDTESLLSIAESKGLAVHENYMFAFHSQIEWVQTKLKKSVVGTPRLIRVDFGFPFRGRGDFRYSKALGGGALLDCGGYTIKLAAQLLGPSARVMTARLNGGRGLDVDLFGSATLENEDGLIAQLSFGMDNDYRCSIDVWGSEATLTSGRILTAPAGFEPVMTVRRNGEETTTTLAADDSFLKSIEHFLDCTVDPKVAAARRCEIMHQARLVEDVRSFA